MEEKEALTYEQAAERLAKIVAALEKGGLPLADTVKLFEEGSALAAFCEKTLGEAELKIARLAEQTDQA